MTGGVDDDGYEGHHCGLEVEHPSHWSPHHYQLEGDLVDARQE